MVDSTDRKLNDSERKSLADVLAAAVGRMGDYVLSGPRPDAPPDYQTRGGLVKVWVCDHILELNTIDDFFRTGDYSVMARLLSGDDPDGDVRLPRASNGSTRLILNSALWND